tara:strand:+ start:342 stop:575 length:234 start_codon:yes stop_codon:yes gene_type:complete
MLKGKEHSDKDVLSENLIITNVKEMSREELEQFADRMMVDRNSFLLEIESLRTDLYFCNRNKRLEEIVNGNKNTIST